MSSENDIDLDFSDYEYTEKEFKVPNPDGSVSVYKLVPANGAVARAYDNAQTDSAILNDEGRVIGFKDSARVVPILVAGCTLDHEGNRLKEADVEKWPHAILRKVFIAAKKISKIDRANVELSKLVIKAFCRPDAPIDIHQLRDWVARFEGDEEMDPVYKFFGETDEEKLGKQKAGTAIGSA